MNRSKSILFLLIDKYRMLCRVRGLFMSVAQASESDGRP
jgi:hypothetical protein